ncbi:MAG: hypothetical protein ABSF26_29630 [Thermoguttaceae bacterium]|jgi:hypothetical protein
MKLSKSATVEELQVSSRFESLRRILLAEQYADHLKKPLAYWALPADRRLPLAFLGRTLDDLLHTPFGELSNTPGIGQKKISSFVKLLARAANTDPAHLPADVAQLPVRYPERGGPEAEGGGGDGFNPSAVSEVVWAQWRASVVKHGLGGERLGRFAPSLRNMTRVIWNASLENYTRYTLAEIRAMKTHGEKRVRAILEVFHSVHVLVSGMGTQEHLVVRIVPRLIDQVEQWLGQALQTPGCAGKEEIFEHLVRPLLEQVEIDATQQIANLAKNRLGIFGPITSVRQAARVMGLTRARVYQLLNEINDILAVRWPTGRHQLYELRDKLASEAKHLDPPPDLQQFYAAAELFYPGSRRGAAGPLEHAMLEDEEDDLDAEEEADHFEHHREHAGVGATQPVGYAPA